MAAGASFIAEISKLSSIQQLFEARPQQSNVFKKNTPQIIDKLVAAEPGNITPEELLELFEQINSITSVADITEENKNKNTATEQKTDILFTKFTNNSVGWFEYFANDNYQICIADLLVNHLTADNLVTIQQNLHDDKLLAKIAVLYFEKFLSSTDETTKSKLIRISENKTLFYKMLPFIAISKEELKNLLTKMGFSYTKNIIDVEPSKVLDEIIEIIRKTNINITIPSADKLDYRGSLTSNKHTNNDVDAEATSLLDLLVKYQTAISENRSFTARALLVLIDDTLNGLYKTNTLQKVMQNLSEKKHENVHGLWWIIFCWDKLYYVNKDNSIKIINDILKTISWETLQDQYNGFKILDLIFLKYYHDPKCSIWLNTLFARFNKEQLNTQFLRTNNLSFASKGQVSYLEIAFCHTKSDFLHYLIKEDNFWDQLELEDLVKQRSYGSILWQITAIDKDNISYRDERLDVIVDKFSSELKAEHFVRTGAYSGKATLQLTNSAWLMFLVENYGEKLPGQIWPNVNINYEGFDVRDLLWQHTLIVYSNCSWDVTNNKYLVGKNKESKQEFLKKLKRANQPELSKNEIDNLFSAAKLAHKENFHLSYFVLAERLAAINLIDWAIDAYLLTSKVSYKYNTAMQKVYDLTMSKVNAQSCIFARSSYLSKAMQAAINIQNDEKIAATATTYLQDTKADQVEISLQVIAKLRICKTGSEALLFLDSLATKAQLAKLSQTMEQVEKRVAAIDFSFKQMQLAEKTSEPSSTKPSHKRHGSL